MKVLYISHHAEGTGWAVAAQEHIKALTVTKDVEVVCRAIYLNPNLDTVPDWLKELEQKDSTGCDYVIQHVLPNYMVYNGGFKKCVGLFASETSNFIRSGWTNNLNLMDENWVICRQQIEASRTSGVKTPLAVVPHPCDISKYESPRNKINFGIGDEFTFLTVGEYSQRKNFAALLIAFHTEFLPEEPTRLVFKINSPHFSPNDLQKEFVNFANKIKRDLNLYDLSVYKPEIIITGRLTDDEMLDLQYTCSGYAMGSHGEAWSLGAFDSMGFGKMPIASNFGGMRDYIEDGKTGHLVNGQMTPVMNVPDSLPGLFVGSEDWFSPSIPELRKKMRLVYENSKDENLVKKNRESSRERVKLYSYEEIGKRMKNLLLSKGDYVE